MCLFVLGCGIYLPVTGYDFVNYDDPAYVTDNPRVKSGVTCETIKWAFTTGHSANWHPLTWLSHMLDAELYGSRSGWHHFTNVLLHGLNSVLTFLLFSFATKSLWRSAIVAALFALHPAHVESVAWVAERKDVLSAAFGLACLISYCAYARRRKVGDMEPNHDRTGMLSAGYIAAFVFLALGLMSKPMVVTVPCLMLLLDYWPLNRFERRSSIIRLAAEKIPFFILVAASSVITMVVQKQGGAVQNLRELSLTNRIENAAVSYVRYLGKVFWPTDLATPYPHPGDWPNLVAVGCLLSIISICAGLWLGRRRFPFALVGWLWFLGMLVPVIGIIQVGAQAMADRYTYLPYIGIFFAFVWTAHRLLTWLARACLKSNSSQISASLPTGVPVTNTPAVRGWIAGTITAVVLVVLAWLTTRQIPVWRNSETLFRHAVTVTESNWIAYYNLGWYLDKQGRIEEALDCYKKAVEIDPKFPDPLNNIGCALASLKRYEEAIPYFESMLRFQPTFLEAHLNLANALRELGRADEAIERYRLVLNNKADHKAALNSLGTLLAGRGDFQAAIPCLLKSLALETNQPPTHYTLANALVKTRRLPEALDHYRQAVAGLPGSANVRNDYALCLARVGRLDEAAQILREAILKHPNDTTTRLTLGRVLANQQKNQQAITLFREVLSITPDQPEAHASLGPLLAMEGQIEAAIHHLTEALKRKPDDPVAHLNLGRALASQGKTAEAASHLQKALELRPDYAPARAELENLQRITP